MENESINKKTFIVKDEKKKMVNKKKQELDELYLFLNSEDALKYTKQVMLVMGKEIEKICPGVEFALIARQKSQDSFNKKEEKVLNQGGNQEKKIFDIVGFCIVIQKIPFNVKIEHKLCEKYLKKRAQKSTAITGETKDLEKLKKEYKKLQEDEEKELNEDMDDLNLLEKLGASEEIMKRKKESIRLKVKNVKRRLKASFSHIRDKEKLIDSLQDMYDALDEMSNNTLARYVLNKLLSSPEITKKLGINRIPHRNKVHDGGKSGYYIACHDSVQSSKLKKWIAEVKAMSRQNFNESEEGDAKHSLNEGKQRVFPPFGETEKEKNEFKQEVLNRTPKFFVYQSSKEQENGSIQKARVYVCSEIENVTNHYLEPLEKSPEFFKYILEDEKLFSDEYSVVEDEEMEI